VEEREARSERPCLPYLVGEAEGADVLLVLDEELHDVVLEDVGELALVGEEAGDLFVRFKKGGVGV
jgi:hypothetical protein